MFGIFRMTHNRGCHPGNAELLFLDGNAALADVDLDAGRLVQFLVELITQDRGSLPVHQDCPPNSLVLFPTTSNSY
jgi:hypothetical protein